MFNRKRALIAIAIAFSIAFHPHISSAEDVFTGTDFLKWSRNNQEFYVHTSIGVAVLIADQNDKSQGKCLSDWFSDNERVAQNEIIGAIAKYPSYHPRGTIVAFMEKKCGEFSYR